MCLLVEVTSEQFYFISEDPCWCFKFYFLCLYWSTGLVHIEPFKLFFCNKIAANIIVLLHIHTHTAILANRSTLVAAL